MNKNNKIKKATIPDWWDGNVHVVPGFKKNGRRSFTYILFLENDEKETRACASFFFARSWALQIAEELKVECVEHFTTERLVR